MSAKNAATSFTMAEVTRLASLAAELTPVVDPLLAAIRERLNIVTDAKNVADNATTIKGSLWGDVVNIAEAIATATAATPSLRDWAYTNVMAEFLQSEEANTAKSYASTGKAVLLNLHTKEGTTFESIREMKYAEVRKALKPDANPALTKLAAELAKKVGFIRKNADKHGGETAAARLERLEMVIVAEYNAVKGAKDSKSAATEAAKALRDLQQQQPAAPAVVEVSRRVA